MKRTLFFIPFFLIAWQSKAQIGFDVGIGSQSAKIRETQNYLQYFSVSPSVRYQTNTIFFKVGFRQGMPKNYTFNGYIEDPNGGYQNKTQIGSRFSENGIGFGIGATFSETHSNTRPYLMFEYYSMKERFTFNNTPQNVIIDYISFIGNSGFSQGTVNGKKFVKSTGQFRFSAGFQFAAGSNLTVFQEASININNDGQFYSMNFSIDLGLRYFLNN